MLLIVGAVIVLIAVVIIFGMRRRRMDARNHGWMSERWLAEQRASDSH